ncbi:hypothetical protein HQ544_00485, partial [Candidatus Falkowbacteria bacterium]|nr:hypothetical protein [Candidatus Falkowbacteria bacterium]
MPEKTNNQSAEDLASKASEAKSEAQPRTEQSPESSDSSGSGRAQASS